jgi:type IV pilus assembly protein PilB
MAEAHSDPLMALVKERGLIDDIQFEEVSQEHERTGKPYGEVLKNFGLIDQETQLQIIADYLGTELLDLRTVNYTPELLKLVPASTARMYQCVPVCKWPWGIH